MLEVSQAHILGGTEATQKLKLSSGRNRKRKLAAANVCNCDFKVNPKRTAVISSEVQF